MFIGISLVVQWLRLCTSTAGDVGSILGQGTKTPHTTRCSQKNNNAYHFRVSVVQEFRHGQGGSSPLWSLTGSVQGVIWGCRYLKTYLGACFGWGTLFQVHWHGCWQNSVHHRLWTRSPLSVPCHVRLLIMAACFSKAYWPKRGKSLSFVT